MQIISVVNFIIFLLKVFLRINLANLTYSDRVKTHVEVALHHCTGKRDTLISQCSEVVPVSEGGIEVSTDPSKCVVWWKLRFSLLSCSWSPRWCFLGLAGRMALHRLPWCVALGLCGAAGGWHRVCSSAESCSYTSGGLGEPGRSKSIFPW